MDNYLRKYEIGGLLLTAAQIYVTRFLTIVLPFSLVILPVQLAQNLLLERNFLLGMAISWLLVVPVMTFAIGALTISVSDICIGEPVNPARSYARVLSSMYWKLLKTSFLTGFIVLIGLVCLYVPGLVLMYLLMFTGQVVVIEGLEGMAALKRSAGLGRGYYWRNFLVMILPSLVLAAVPIWIRYSITGSTSTPGDIWTTYFPSTAAHSLLFPYCTILITFLYYDMRMRKEAYDVDSLAEDLRR